MANNLYNAVMELLQYNEEKELKNLVCKIKFPELDEKELELKINTIVKDGK